MNDNQKTNFTQYIVDNVKDAEKVIKAYEKSQIEEDIAKSIVKALKGLYSHKIKIRDNEVFVSDSFLFVIDLDFNSYGITFRFNRYDQPNKTFSFYDVLLYHEVFLDFITDKKFFEHITWYLIKPLQIKAENEQK